MLIPGVGNDAAVVDMFDDGYLDLTAMDYAPEGIERCRELLGKLWMYVLNTLSPEPSLTK